MQALRPVPASSHGSRTTFVYKDLATTPYVFVRNDAMKSCLQPNYDGPFEVINREKKFYTVQTAEKVVKVSTDRLKPAYVLVEDPGISPRSVLSDANHERLKHLMFQ
ncbi:hypothetical protein NQ315_008916 [Exocentrus adspersus]|uniref:Uncharacterized protein n=1 Tax=Exocentrus adspersus TaxID=1586481 RepID=A0AAV8VBP0_9CUCU|nr:hypothetical protein NQ315_008916 [Exocentrus adspersus]